MRGARAASRNCIKMELEGKLSTHHGDLPNERLSLLLKVRLLAA
jgi:hypothetical protein